MQLVETKQNRLQITMINKQKLPKSIQALHVFLSLTLFRMGLFVAARGWGQWVAKSPPPLNPKISHTYRTMIELDIVIIYLKKIQKLYKSRDTPLEFC